MLPTVTAKIRSLYDCQLRLMHNIQPLPSGTDIANTVKYFSQTLLSKYQLRSVAGLETVGLRSRSIRPQSGTDIANSYFSHMLPSKNLPRVGGWETL